MKSPVCLLLLALALVLPAGAATPASSAAKKAPAEKKAAEKPKIEGQEVARGDGFLGIQILNSNLRIAFYDAKRQPVAADLDRIVARWDPKYKVGEERVVLLPDGEGKVFTAGRAIRPPYQFKLFLTLVREAKPGREPLTETLVVDFRQ